MIPDEVRIMLHQRVRADALVDLAVWLVCGVVLVNTTPLEAALARARREERLRCAAELDQLAADEREHAFTATLGTERDTAESRGDALQAAADRLRIGCGRCGGRT